MGASRLQELIQLLQSLPDDSHVDLGALLSRWEKASPTMDREEALIRFLHELSREARTPE